MTSEKQLHSERIYGLDALRVIMMLLGIILHSAVTFSVTEHHSDWPLKDSDTHVGFDFLVAFIHSFRMPVFFLASGYFGALLFYNKGPKAMLVNRFKRIVLPFLVSLFLIYPLVLLAFVFSRAAFAEAASLSVSEVKVFNFTELLPSSLIHLWFLYFLAIYALLGCGLSMLFSKPTAFTNRIIQCVTTILHHFWLRTLCMAVLFFACLYWMGSPSVLTNNRWAIDPGIFTTYFIFFGTGWMIYTTKSLTHLKRYPVLQLGFASLLFLLTQYWSQSGSMPAPTLHMMLSAVYGSLFIFGFIAFALTYLNHFSSKLTYLMESSYWVYIIHLPFVAFIPGLLAPFTIPVVIKFAITFFITLTICMVSYQLLVRGSFIGKFLNGKVYKKRRISISE